MFSDFTEKKALFAPYGPGIEYGEVKGSKNMSVKIISNSG